MDEQPITDPASVDDDVDTQDAVDTVDLAAVGGEPPPKGVWAGRIAIGALAVALVAGGIAIAQDDDGDEPTRNGTTEPLALVPGLADAESTGDAAMYPYGEIEYRLEGTLPDLGAEAPVYRLVQTELTADDLTRMATALGVEGTPTEADGGWTVDDGTSSMWAYPSGGSWSVGYGSSVQVFEDAPPPSAGSGSSGSSGDDIEPAQTEPALTDGNPVAVEEIPADDPDAPVSSDDEGDTTTIEDPPITHTVPIDEPIEPVALPSEAEAEQIATDLLGEMGVTADAEWAVTVHEGTMMGYAVACEVDAEGGCEDTPTTETLLSWSVSFQRVVDGVTTVGLEWGVEVGDEGVVTSVYGTLADLQEMGDYPLRSTQAAFDQLQSGEGTYPGPVPLGAPEAVSSVEDMTGTVVTGGEDSVGDEAPEGPVDMSDVQCVTDPCPGFDTPATTVACFDADGSVVDCELVDPVPTCGPNERCANPEMPVECDSLDCVGPPTTIYEPEPTVVIVTGAELGATVTWATEGGVEVQYLVPSYHFVGHYADGTDWSTDVIAVADSMITEPEVPHTTVDTAVPPPVETIVPEPDCTNEAAEGCAGSIPTTWIDEPVTTIPPTTVPATSAPPSTTYPTTTAGVAPPPG